VRDAGQKAQQEEEQHLHWLEGERAIEVDVRETMAACERAVRAGLLQRW
jgi:hypothetical protein